MYQIIYVSSAKNLFTPDELVELLRKAREKNERLGITGMLLYKGGNFIQVLEGPEEAVKDLYATITKDQRHHTILSMSRQQIEKREFGEWSMGFTDLAKLSEKDMPGLSKFLEEPMTPDSFKDNPSRARVLLEAFRANMR